MTARTKSGAKGMGQCYRRSYLDIGLGIELRCRDIYDDPAWQVLIYISDIIHYIYSLAIEMVLSRLARALTISRDLQNRAREGHARMVTVPNHISACRAAWGFARTSYNSQAWLGTGSREST